MAAVLADDLDKANEWSKVCRHLLRINETASLKDSMANKFFSSISRYRSHEDDDDDDDNDNLLPAVCESKSTGLFLAHRRKEMELQLDDIEEYIRLSVLRDDDNNDFGDGDDDNDDDREKLKRPHKLIERLHPAVSGLSKLLYFGFDDYGDDALGRGVNTHLGRSRVADEVLSEQIRPLIDLFSIVCHKFGLETLLQSLYGDEDDDKEVRVVFDAVKFRMESYMDHETQGLRLNNIFGNDKDIKLELCSGDGEWVVQHAYEDRGRANWIACELRCDRSYHIYAKSVMQGVTNNLAVLSGDASNILNRFGNESISQIFINHPEPPERSGDHKSQGEHMLTWQFFQQMKRVLKSEDEDKHVLTIVTDNVKYAVMLANILNSESVQLFRSKVMSETSQRTIHSRVGVVTIWCGAPGIKGGHLIADASSYFDRLWDNGKKKKRWFLCLVK